MKILIDFTQIPLQKAGMGVYALNLILSIAKIDQKNTYYILIQNDEYSFEFIANTKIRILKVNSKYFRNRLLRIFLEQLYIPFLTIKHKIKAVHSFHYSFPIFIFAKRIITIPDMTLYKFPNFHIKTYVYYFRFFIWLSSIFADKIITISYSSKSDIVSKFNIDKSKITVTYLSYDLPERSSISLNEIEDVKNKFEIRREYILNIGTIEPRKNIENLIFAFDKFKKENKSVQLVIVGKMGWHSEKLLKLLNNYKKSIILTGYIRKRDKAILLAGSKFFVYPSIYEGFGIPVLEALSYGIPTITSNTSSLKEITNNSTLLINPLKVDEIYNAMNRISNDYTLYNELKRKSIEQAKRFTWDKSAQETIEVYNSLDS